MVLKVLVHLYVRRKPRIRLEAQMHGGGHERGFRSGTLPVHQIVGMGEAFRIAKEDMAKDTQEIIALSATVYGMALKTSKRLISMVTWTIMYQVSFNISFNFVEGESLLMALKRHGGIFRFCMYFSKFRTFLCIKSVRLSDELAHSSIRFQYWSFHNRRRN